jgi:hypothetical protein
MRLQALDYFCRLRHSTALLIRPPTVVFGEPTEEADAYRITYRQRAQRRHRTVGSTERLAAYWRVRGLLGLLLPHE